MKTRLAIGVALLGATPTLIGATPVGADPMRPLAAPASTAPGAGTGTTPPAPSAQPTLQADRLVAIRRDADGRFQALIGERWVSLGDKPGGRAGNAVVRALDASSVTLALGRQQLVLHVLPPLVASRPDAGEPGASPDAAGPRTAALGATRAGLVAQPTPRATSSRPAEPDRLDRGGAAVSTSPTSPIVAATAPRAAP